MRGERQTGMAHQHPVARMAGRVQRHIDHRARRHRQGKLRRTTVGRGRYGHGCDRGDPGQIGQGGRGADDALGLAAGRRHPQRFNRVPGGNCDRQHSDDPQNLLAADHLPNALTES